MRAGDAFTDDEILGRAIYTPWRFDRGNEIMSKQGRRVVVS